MTREPVAAGVRKAVGIFVFTERDTLNLAAVTRARLIDASMASLRFVKAEIVSHKARQLLKSPPLIRFPKYLDEDSRDLVRGTARTVGKMRYRQGTVHVGFR